MHGDDRRHRPARRHIGLSVSLLLAVTVLALQMASAQAPTSHAQELILVRVEAPSVVDESARTVTVSWIFFGRTPVDHTDIHWDITPHPARDYPFVAEADEATAGPEGEAEAEEATAGPTISTFTATLTIPSGVSTIYYRVHGTAGDSLSWTGERSIAVIAVAESIPEAGAAIVFVETAFGTGSGFIVNAQQILTNQHVVETETEVTVRFADGTQRVGTVTAIDRELDVAVIEVPDMPQGVLRLDWESALRPPVATDVWAWGFPGPLVPSEQDADDVFAATVTRGIVSARQQLDGVLYLQTDATMNPGNSGGPLIDANGRVVGINTIKLFGEGMALALNLTDYGDRIGDLLTGEGPRPAESVSDIEFLSITPVGVSFDVFFETFLVCDTDAESPDDYQAFSGLCVTASYENFEPETVVRVVWTVDGETLCDDQVILWEQILDGENFVRCSVADGPRLSEFRSDEYTVTFTFDLVVIGEASRQISVPERFETVVTGDLPSDADEDVYEFTASEGTFVGVMVDTVSDETAFDVAACISTTSDSLDCFAFGDDEIDCTFPPPLFACPQIATTLPADDDGVYYLRVTGFSSGEYEVTALSTPAIGPLQLVVDNGS